MTLNIQSELRQNDLGHILFMVKHQSPDINPAENLWQNVKIDVYTHSLLSLTELEPFCKQGWTTIFNI